VLPWIVGFKNANELLLAGNNDIDATRAAAMGLVNRVVAPEDLFEEAQAMAELIASNDSLAVQLTKKAIHRSMETAGFRRALEDALELDIQIEPTDTAESVAFHEMVEREGLKAALNYRANQAKNAQ
ncbi:MAG: enoyl-CoA hydratase/isomerase family protein, partial [Woeseiaceae bacterium]